MAEKRNVPAGLPRRASKPLLKKASDSDEVDVVDAASPATALISRQNQTGRTDINSNNDHESIIENEQPFSNNSQNEDASTAENEDMRFQGKGKLDSSSTSNRDNATDKKVRGTKKSQSTPALISISADARDVSKYAMHSKMTTSLGPSNFKKLIPNERTFVGRGSVVYEDTGSKIMHHASRGEWGQVDLMIRVSQQRGDSDIFASDKVSM